MSGVVSGPNQHASSHGVKGADPTGNGTLMRRTLLTLVPSATGGQQGAAQTILPTPPLGSLAIVSPFNIFAAGVAISGETLTVDLIFVYSDGTNTVAETLSLTATGTVVVFGNNVFAALFKDDVTITSIICSVASSKANSTATATLTYAGYQGA